MKKISMKTILIKRASVVSLMLLTSMALAFIFPKAKPMARSSMPLTHLHLSPHLPGWDTQDISDNINTGSANMHFLGHFQAQEFDSNQGPILYLFLLDTSNYSQPKFSVGGPDFIPEQLKEIDFKLSDHDWKAKAIYFQKNDEGFLTVYWLNEGQMVRIDITTTKDQIPQASQLIQDFLTSLFKQVPVDQQESLVG